MDAFHFAEFGKLRYIYHTTDTYTYSGCKLATALSSEKADCVITHLLEIMAIMGIPTQIKTDNAPSHVSNKMKQFFIHYNIKHVPSILHNPTIDRANRTLKEMLIKQKGRVKSLRNRLNNALLTLHFLNISEKRNNSSWERLGYQNQTNKQKTWGTKPTSILQKCVNIEMETCKDRDMVMLTYLQGMRKYGYQQNL